jgi:hypothetical protein
VLRQKPLGVLQKLVCKLNEVCSSGSSSGGSNGDVEV